MVKTRFAPSPTGYLHVGGLRTALFSYLYAKKNNGIFGLRIEDTDRERFVEGGIENIIRSLKWAGLDIDEGVDLDEENKITQKGNCGPYIQSERLEKYHKYVQELIDNEHAYPCFCTKERLAELRQYQELNKLALLFPSQSISYEKVSQSISNVSRYDTFELTEANLVDEQRVEDFIARYRDKGPEYVPQMTGKRYE